jgi:hypothetical protein
VQTILNAHCIGCHTGPSSNNVGDLPAGLDLNNVLAVVGTASLQCTAKVRIVANSASTSYLVDKIMGASQTSGGCFAGVRMPRNLPPLSTADMNTIIGWINAGAH